jgi:hypothetical protein
MLKLCVVFVVIGVACGQNLQVSAIRDSDLYFIFCVIFLLKLFAVVLHIKQRFTNKSVILS